MKRSARPARSAVTSRVKPRLTIREVTDVADPALRESYGLLRRTFHRGERVTLAEWRGTMVERMSGLWTDLAWHLLVAERDGQVVGLASGTYLGNVNLGVIGYLAISPDARSTGIGSRLRTRLRAIFGRDALRIAGEPLSGIIGEVSIGNPWLEALAKRENVLVLDFQYFQPRLYPEDAASPFALYHESLLGTRRSLPVGELRRILYTVWRRIYRVGRPLSRPAFRKMMRALDGRRTVGQAGAFNRRSRP